MFELEEVQRKHDELNAYQMKEATALDRINDVEE